jgi:hypothetical protein
MALPRRDVIIASLVDPCGTLATLRQRQRPITSGFALQ